MEAREATGTQSRTERADFQETADPALIEAADRTANVKLLSYGELYDLYDDKGNWRGALSEADAATVPAERTEYLPGPAGSISARLYRPERSGTFKPS